MKDINTLLSIIHENEAIARKFDEIEIQILSILSFSELFETLLSQIKEKFNIPHVWISLINSGEIPDLIQSLDTSDVLKSHLKTIDPHLFFKLVPTGKRPLLINQHLDRFSILFPEIVFDSSINSISISPITFNGSVIGSLNQADSSPLRFSPGMDTSLLESLARKVSLCLSNVTLHEKLSFLAYHDPLTGLLNRRVMESILEREFLRGKRYSSPLSVVFLDIDKFKSVNDSFGHNAGDVLLQHAAKRLSALVRNSDVVARFAGDEFVIILPETEMLQTINLMERIQSHFKLNLFNICGQTFSIGISYGTASSDDPAVSDHLSLLHLADKRLYEMKEIKSTEKS